MKRAATKVPATRSKMIDIIDAGPYLRQALSLYDRSPLRSRMYLWIRRRNFPLKAMWPVLLGLNGFTVSIGAGYAIFEIAAALANPNARFLATDLSHSRVTLGQSVVRGIPNIEFGIVDLRNGIPPPGTPDAFLLLDVLHHLEPTIQEIVLTQIAAALKTGGRVVIKECGTRPAWKRWFNRLNDAIGAPFTPIYPRSEEAWAELLTARGLSTTTSRIDYASPYAHILIEGTRS